MVLSQTTAVSRWFVMPTAAMSSCVRLPRVRARPTTSRTLFQICSGLCSTHPARGKIWSCSSCPVE
ncbi:Uncharacterised protein [Mycobacteroides abscessus]|nr:Uncharacterised protein [Mycobacteroides abscessus]